MADHWNAAGPTVVGFEEAAVRQNGKRPIRTRRRFPVDNRTALLHSSQIGPGGTGGQAVQSRRQDFSGSSKCQHPAPTVVVVTQQAKGGLK